MEYVRFAFSALFILVGLFITVCSVRGFYKLKFILNRMHAAALIDTLGILFVILGVIIAIGFKNEDGSFNVTSLKMMLVVVFLWLSSPVSSHLISKLIYMTDTNTEKETVEMEASQQGKENREDD